MAKVVFQSAVHLLFLSKSFSSMPCLISRPQTGFVPGRACYLRHLSAVCPVALQVVHHIGCVSRDSGSCSGGQSAARICVHRGAMHGCRHQWSGQSLFLHMPHTRACPGWWLHTSHLNLLFAFGELSLIVVRSFLLLYSVSGVGLRSLQSHGQALVALLSWSGAGKEPG